jgi:serine/threonine-protein kinase
MIGPQVGERISEYVLDELIGSGGFGQVWKAHHHIWKTDLVAIKIPTDSRFVRNLQKEGLTVHGLRHPNIVRAIGLDPYADIPYLVMEYIDGPSLDKLIAKFPEGLPVRTVQRILCGVLQALDYAHGSGVIHRDIKPANILIAGGAAKPVESIAVEDVKVTDFGLGKAGEITASSILQSGSLLAEDGRSISGTLAYMAPEQRDGGETDARSDLYSIGIVLFEMICGQRPSGSDMPSQVRPALPSWVDLAYGRLYTRRERRLASAAEALRMIDNMSVPPVIAGAARGFPRRRHRRFPRHGAPIRGVRPVERPSRRETTSASCAGCRSLPKYESA